MPLSLKHWHADLKDSIDASVVFSQRNIIYSTTPQNEVVEALKADELAGWKKQSWYHQRSKAETAMYCYKRLINPKLSRRNNNAHVGEMQAGINVLNKAIGLGMPVRQQLK